MLRIVSINYVLWLQFIYLDMSMKLTYIDIFIHNNITLSHKAIFHNFLITSVPHPRHCQHGVQVWALWCCMLSDEKESWLGSQDMTHPHCFLHLSFDSFHWWLAVRMSARRCCQLQYMKQTQQKKKYTLQVKYHIFSRTTCYNFKASI